MEGAATLTARPPSLRERLLVLVPSALFVAATTHWMSWDEPIRRHFAADVKGYEAVARAAPHFTWPQVEGHVGMWPVHYLVGLLAKETGVPLHVTYYALATLVLAVILGTADRILCFVGVDLSVYALAMTVLLMNPYIFRYLALAPGMLNDTVFVACVALTVRALLLRRFGWLLGALTVAALARGWSVPPVLLGAALWLVLERRKDGLRLAAAVVAVPLVAYALAYWAGSTAPGHAQVVKNCCSVWNLTILGDLRRLPHSAGAIALHVGRVGTGIALALALLVAASRLARRHRAAARVPDEVWWLCVLAAVMVAEPLVVSAVWNEGDEPRLASFAVVPIAAAAALVLTTLEEAGAVDLTRNRVIAAAGVGWIASLSHRFAVVGTRSPAQFAALELAASIALVWIVAGRRFVRLHGGRPARLGGTTDTETLP